MNSTKLKEDLANCLINFDRRVLVTELLDDYKVPYEEVTNVLIDYMMKQEKTQKLKYEKRYMVHGLEEGDNNKEIYKIVDEDKQKEWINKLKRAETSLYSVEVAGGSKTPAAVFKHMSIAEGVKLRVGLRTKTANGSAASTSASNSVLVKKETKIETIKPEPQNVFAKSSSKKISPKAKTPTKKSPKTEDSPTESKKSKEKSAQKKGINNFFASAAATKKSEDLKDSKSTGVVKPPTPKKMQDFFKKQTETLKSAAKETKPSVNTSIQLFDDQEDEEPQEVDSSDEDEKLDALKRAMVSSDVEMEDEDGESTKPSTSKRRRILDSDDEEDENPPVKQEKLDIKEPERESSPQLDETYLDDEGFVITKKPKQKGQTTTPKSKTAKKTPPLTAKKISPKDAKKSAATTSTKDSKSNPPAKTKQAGIMNFFTKK